MTQKEVLKKLIEHLAKGYSNSLIVVGSAGIGKTEGTMKTLTELGFQEGQHFTYLANYITPRGFIEVLDEINNLKEPRILILDDIENTLRSPAVVGLLKGALWQAGGKRRVCWRTNREKIEFEFFGKVIILLNYFNIKNPVINALKDRADYYEMDLTPQDIANQMLDIAKQPYLEIPVSKRLEVANFLIEVGIKSPHFSLRLLPRALGYFKSSPNHWQKLVSELL